MTKDTQDNKKNEKAVMKPMVPESAAYGGVALFIVGMAIMYLSGRAHPSTVDRMNYLGIAVVAAGCILWFTAGMERAQLFEWMRSGATALLLALVIRWAIAEPYRIPSGSMETTLHGDPRFGRGDRVFVNKWVYGIRYPFMNKRIWQGHMPERWDIVVFKTVEPDAVHKTLVKRVVGMPGEHIQIRNGKVYANGEPLELPDALPADTRYTAPLDGPYGVQPAEQFSQVPEGHYLVMGDNSAHSRDGRYFGWLPNEHIVGRVACIWWPPPRWRDFTGFSKTLWWRGLIVMLAAAIVLRLFVGRLCPVHSPADSAKVDHLIISFASYGLYMPLLGKLVVRRRLPQRGELALYRMKDAASGLEATLVGRIAGMPGEQVSLQDGALLINGDETVLPAPAPARYEGMASNARYGRGKGREYTLVPEGHYFILADETLPDDMPADSRMLGWIPMDAIQGRAVCCWWPPSRMGRR